MKINIGGKTYDVDDAKLKDGDNLVTEIEIETTDVIRTEAEETTFKENTKQVGQKIGSEMAIKKFKEHIGVDVQGKNTDAFPAIAEAYKNNILAEANINPNEKVVKLNEDLLALKEVNTGLQNELKAEKQQSIDRENTYKIQNEVFSNLPDNLSLPKSDMIILLGSKLEFTKNENGVTVTKNLETGKVYQNNVTLDPIPVKEVLTSFFTENPGYIKGAGGGAGGGDSNTGGGKKTVESWTEAYLEKNPDVSPNSDKFIADIQAARKSGEIDD